MLPHEKLESLARRYADLDDLMCQPHVLSDRNQLAKLTKERSDLAGLMSGYSIYKTKLEELAKAKELFDDPDFRELAEAEVGTLTGEIAKLEETLRLLLLPKDPNDAKNTILEIRSGEGGEEAALFAADLYRMYARFAETRAWKLEILTSSESTTGGYKEVIALIVGKDVYSQLRFEGGVHRVQRVPATETQGRIHTSTATVAVLPEAEDVDVTLDERDLEISIAASGGPGGQGVNTTNSAVQILHKPTGMIVKCQDERSQLKNKAKALKVLKSRLLDIEREKQEAAQSAERRSMVSTGERSQKIRTYNYAQNRVTDHRIRLTLNKLDRIIEGDLEELISALRTTRQAELLGEVSAAPRGSAGAEDD
jgi:peptide chain release factor 1